MEIFNPAHCVSNEAELHAFFGAALADWMGARLRCPSKARFGNLNAKKPRKQVEKEETRTELPIDLEPVVASGGEEVELPSGLDEMADKGEEQGSATLFESSSGGDEVDDLAGVEPFVVPSQHVLVSDCPATEAKALKTAGKFALKFPEGWETATFRGQYKGRKPEFKGGFDFYLQGCKRKITMMLDDSKYGLGGSWVAFKKV